MRAPSLVADALASTRNLCVQILELESVLGSKEFLDGEFSAPLWHLRNVCDAMATMCKASNNRMSQGCMRWQRTDGGPLVAPLSPPLTPTPSPSDSWTLPTLPPSSSTPSFPAGIGASAVVACGAASSAVGGGGVEEPSEKRTVSSTSSIITSSIRITPGASATAGAGAPYSNARLTKRSRPGRHHTVTDDTPTAPGSC